MGKQDSKRLKVDDLNDEGVMRLIEAIVGGAAEEWRECRLMLANNPNDKKSREQMQYLERFFKSEYFHNLTNLDGVLILKQLEADWIAERKMKVSAMMRSK